MTSHWEWLLLIVPFLVLIRILMPDWSKGTLGEHKVNAGISRLLDQNVYRLIKNVTLPIGNSTTQIDHLIVSPFGIFVIETKNMKGWIFGQPHQAQWTQVIYRFKHKFQNPLLQNKMHVEALRDLLGLRPDCLHSVVVFIGDCTFKTPMPPEVVQGVFGLAAFVQATRSLIFTDDEVRRFVEVIQTNRLDPGPLTDSIHVQNVKKRTADKAVVQGIDCPKCGSDMVERVKRRTGEHFLGCKRFPRCRGIRSLP